MPEKRSRRRGRGALYRYKTKAGERWRWQLYVPVDPNDDAAGERRTGGGGFITMEGADDALREALKRLKEQGTIRTDSGLTIAEYGHTWIDGLRLADSTIAGYRKLLRLHALPYIGTLPLEKLRATHLAKLYRDLESRGRKDAGHEGEPLGANTVRKVHTMLGSMLQAAVDERLIVANPARMKAANPPTLKQVRTAKPEIHPWTVDQSQAFIAWSKKYDSDLHAAWVVALRTGVRRGELVALRWGDFSPTARTLAVRRAVALIKEQGKQERFVVKLPKNDRTRVLDLDDETVLALKAWKLRVGKIDMRMVSATSYIFARTDTGALRHPERTSRRFVSEIKQARDQLGDSLPAVSLHELRHTHATLLLQAGVQPKVVQERLGHTTIAITMDLYSHVMPTVQRAAVDAFAQLLG